MRAGPRSDWCVEVLTAFLLSAVIICLVAFTAGACAALLAKPPDPAALIAAFGAQYAIFVAPEPVERAAYLAGLASAVPAVLLATYLAEIWQPPPAVPVAAVASVLIAGALMATLLQGSLFSYVIDGGNGKTAERDATLTTALLWLSIPAALAAITAGIFGANSLRLSRLGQQRLVDAIGLAMLCLTVVAVRMRSAVMIDADGHVEAVLYSIVQVHGGMTMLADLPGQYGLYAEILLPLFRLTGLSVIKFTLVMTLLQGIGALCIFLVTRRLVRTPWMRLLLLLTLCLFIGNSYTTFGFTPTHSEFYQLWPIRFVFPALGMAAFVHMRRTGMTERQLAGFALLAGVAIVWNLDSGVPVYGAMVACLLARLASRPRVERRANLRRVFIAAVGPLLVVAAFAVYLTVKAHGEIDWSLATKYQRLFYATGLGMLPLPRAPHQWMAVLGLYLFGLLGAARAHLQGRASVSSDTLLFISVLGIGLFTYYQGRSHDLVLSFVMYPALIVAFVLCDQLLRFVRAGRAPAVLGWTAAPVVFFGIVMSALIVISIPHLVKMTKDAVRAMRSDVPNMTTANVDFIRQKVGNDRTAYIIDRAQAVYFAESGTHAAIRGPSMVEMLTSQDFQFTLDQLMAHPIDHLFIRQNTAKAYAPQLIQLLRVYRPVETNPWGLTYFEPIR